MLRVTGYLTLAALTLLVLGCSRLAERELLSSAQPGTAAPVSAVDEQSTAATADKPLAPLPGFPALPAPQDLPRSGSAATGDRRLTGSEYDSALPAARVFPNAADLSFAPAGDALSEAAYAIFHFDLPGYSGAGSIETAWDSLPAAGDYFIGVADYASGSWQWFGGDPADPVVLPAGLNFMSSAEQVYVVVLLTGSAVHALQQVVFGGDQPPTAVLRPQYYFADISTTVGFDASESTDDNLIAKYEWDLNGDGTFELDSGLDPSASKLYPLAADITVQLKVTDDSGQSSVVSADLRIDATGYDETEPNNDLASADVLPPLPLQGWDGNLGTGGYDGGDQDYYSFDVSEPMRVVFSVDELATEAFKLAVYDASGTELLRDGTYMTGHITLHYYFTTPGTFILEVYSGALTSIDYSLSTEVEYETGYDEVEPNNSTVLANALDPGGVSNFWGSLGAFGYDGTLEDWYSLEVATPNTYFAFILDHYADQVNIDIELYDDTSTLLASSALDIGQEYIGYGFADAGSYYLRCFVRPGGDSSAHGDYLLHVQDLGPMPEVQLVATPDNGTRPLHVFFDASGTTIPDGTYIVEFRWDLNGDGLTESTTFNPESDCYYYAGGSYAPRVRVLLVTGAIGVGSTSVDVSGAPSEAEPNDDYGAAQSLPGFPFMDFFGDVGPGGYNGGPYDYYAFALPAGNTAAFSLDYQPLFILLGAQIVSNDGSPVILAESYENDGNEYVSYTNFSGAAQDLFLLVVTDPEWPGGFGGYELSGSMF